MERKIYNKNIKINMPEPVKKIIRTLSEHGYEAYAVGGCVRDSILGKEPKDWDITTSAKPQEIKALFARTADTGIRHGTVTVIIKATGYEVTTYRVDGSYEDGRHPKEVTFTASLTEDLKRRDFTINAMAYNDETGLTDCFGGIEDLNCGVIRCVGEAEERFMEDALRMLRALRFGAVLGFDICEDTWNAIEKLAPAIAKISRERIQAELDKLLMSEHPDRVSEVHGTGLLKQIFAGQQKNGTEDILAGRVLEEPLKNSPKDHYIRWAVFISFVQAEAVLKSLKFDNSTIQICNRLLEYKEEVLPRDEAELRRTIVKIGKDIFGRYYLPYRRALGNIDEQSFGEAETLYERIEKRGDCLSIKELAVNGEDLAQIGIEPGKRMGEVLKYLFDMVLEDCTKNEKEMLLEAAKNYT